MNLGCLLAAPTLVRLRGEPWLARPLTLGDFALLLRGAADAIGMDADAGDEPTFADPRVVDWLTGAGAPLLLWCALRRDRAAFALDEAATLAATAGAEEVASVFHAAMRRDRSATPTEGEGVDVARLRWSRVAYRFYSDAGKLPDALAALTLDQVWAIASKGESDDGPAEDGMARMQAAYEAERARRSAGPEGPAEVTLADLGLEIVPDRGEADHG